MVATGQVSNMQESHTVTVMEGIKWQQRDSYSAIICPAECKLFSNNQEARSKRESAVITIACCCFKRIHIHTGHTASTRHILYLSLVSLAQDFVFAHFHLPSHDLTTQLYGLRLSCSVQYLMGLNATFGHLVDNYSKTCRLFIDHQLKKTTDEFPSFQCSLVLRLEFVCSLGSQFRRGAGVLDIVFETPFQLLTCGYDTFIRMWDLRLNPRCVSVICLSGWAQIYCIKYNDLYYIISTVKHLLHSSSLL